MEINILEHLFIDKSINRESIIFPLTLPGVNNFHVMVMPRVQPLLMGLKRICIMYMYRNQGFDANVDLQPILTHMRSEISKVINILCFSQ